MFTTEFTEIKHALISLLGNMSQQEIETLLVFAFIGSLIGYIVLLKEASLLFWDFLIWFTRVFFKILAFLAKIFTGKVKVKIENQ